jgi:hypothetical protein
VHRRIFLGNAVNGLIKDYGLILYGSFLTKSFHFPSSMNYSFSDIDLISQSELGFDERMVMQESIKDHLLDQFGIGFRVSIRNKRIHEDTLANEVSYAVSFLETLLKLMDKPSNKEHSHYQLAKIYLRIVYRDYYFTSGVNFEYRLNDSNVLKKCCQIKTQGGEFSQHEMYCCTKEIEQSSSIIGQDINLLLNSGLLVEDIYQKYSHILIENQADNLVDDARNKLSAAKIAHKEIDWDKERFQPLF